MDLLKTKRLLLEENGELSYKTNIEGETFQVNIDTDKDGINLSFTPVNPTGDMIYNLSEEEVETLKNSLMTTLGPKFARYKMELSAEDIKGDSKTINILIPVGSIFPFLQNIISK